MNQESLVPLTRMPTLTPLRAKAVTIVEASTPCPAVVHSLLAAIEKFQNQ